MNMGAWAWFWIGFAAGAASVAALAGVALGAVRLWQRSAIRQCGGADIDVR